jgi:F-box/TPR repeat protein Pof3
VTIHRFEHVDVLKNIAKVCKSLTELEFISLPHTMASTLIEIVACAPKLEKFVVHPDITVDTATQILNTRPTLKHVGFNAVKPTRYAAEWTGPFPNLESFTLHFTDPGSILTLSPATLLTSVPTLHSLVLGNMHTTTDMLHTLSTPPLTTLILTLHQHTGFLPLLPSTLQTLSISSTGSTIELQSLEHHFLRSSLPHLTSLSLTGLSRFSAKHLTDLLDHSTNDNNNEVVPLANASPLTSLTIHCLLSPNTTSLFSPLHNNNNTTDTSSLLSPSPRILTPALKHLDVASMAFVDDDAIEALLAGHDVSGLRSVDVSRTNVSGAGIKMLVDGLPVLERVRADQCARVSGRGCLEYAAGKGVRVACSMAEGVGKGRRVRY